jgi:hypothetical protein
MMIVVSLLVDASFLPLFEYCRNQTSSLWCFRSRTALVGKSSLSQLWSRYSDGDAAVLWYRQFSIQPFLTSSSNTDNRCSGIMILGEMDSIAR